MGESVWIVLFLLGHALGDFYFQSKNSVRKKEEDSRYVVQHAAIYASCLAIIFLITCQLNLALIGLVLSIFALHLLTDLSKRQAARAPKLPLFKKANIGEYLFFLDQGLHFVTLILLALIFFPFIKPQDWFANLSSLEMGWSVHPVMLLTAIVYTIYPVSLFIEKILLICNIKPTEDTGFVNGGKIIGILERLLVTFLLLMLQFNAIGFVIAAKSLARFRDLDDRKCAEYYIIGTFLSLVAAGVVTTITLL